MIDAKLKNVPKLGFSEFNGEWEKKKLGDFAKIYDGTHQTPNYVKKGVPFYSVEHLTANQFEATKFIKDSVFERENKRVKLEKDDILMTRIGSIGVSKHIDWNVYASFYVSLALIKIPATVDAKFINQNIQTSFFQNQLWRRTIHVAFPKKINLGEISQCKIYIPTSKEEQTKIASFLTAVDNKTEQLGQKKVLFEQYKKGMMQQLFSQKIRFKNDDGMEFSKWEAKTLGDLAKIVGGGTPETINQRYWNGNIEWFTPSELKKKYLSSSKRKISLLGFESSSAKQLPKGTLLLSTRATIGDISIASKECTTNQGFQSLIVNTNNFNEYWYYWLLNNKHQLLRRASGSTFFEISKTEIQKIEVLRPSRMEQIKIANFLSRLDQKIEQLNEQINQAKTFKKGLLQKMLI